MPISPLADVSSRYGAPMGRQDSDKLDSAIRAFREAEFRMNALRSSYSPEELREDLPDVAEATAEMRALRSPA